MIEPSNEYTLSGHARMLRDQVRVEAYTNALHAVVGPDSVVLDVGTGVGYFAVAAALFGASHVYAIERDDVAYHARAIVEDNGVIDRVTIYRGTSLQLTLDDPPTIVISDLRGVLPLYGDHIRTVVDARDRLARPDATLIPKADHLFVAVATSRAAYDQVIAPWDAKVGGIDLTSAKKFAENSWVPVACSSEAMLSAPERWHSLDYSTVQLPDVDGSANLDVERDADAHGLLIWFDAELADGIGYSNSPDSTCVYGQAFFPFAQILDAKAGDQVRVSLDAKFSHGDYVWSWATTHLRDRSVLASFDQSTIRSLIRRPT